MARQQQKLLEAQLSAATAKSPEERVTNFEERINRLTVLSPGYVPPLVTHADPLRIPQVPQHSYDDPPVQNIPAPVPNVTRRYPNRVDMPPANDIGSQRMLDTNLDSLQVQHVNHLQYLSLIHI